MILLWLIRVSPSLSNATKPSLIMRDIIDPWFCFINLLIRSLEKTPYLKSSSKVIIFFLSLVVGLAFTHLPRSRAFSQDILSVPALIASVYNTVLTNDFTADILRRMQS